MATPTERDANRGLTLAAAIREALSLDAAAAIAGQALAEFREAGYDEADRQREQDLAEEFAREHEGEALRAEQSSTWARTTGQGYKAEQLARIAATHREIAGKYRSGALRVSRK